MGPSMLGVGETRTKEAADRFEASVAAGGEDPRCGRAACRKGRAALGSRRGCLSYVEAPAEVGSLEWQ